MHKLDVLLEEMPVVAILRGIIPSQAASIAGVLIDEGIRIIEVPLNSPRPFESIANMVREHGDRALFGAGTVINIDDIARIQNVGGTLVVSPHCDPALISASISRVMIPVPGFFTATEAFSALSAGAKHLKFFPADRSIFRAISAVLPKEAKVIAVGGIEKDSISNWTGVDGFGVGSALFRPGDELVDIRRKTRIFVDAVRRNRS